MANIVVAYSWNLTGADASAMNLGRYLADQVKGSLIGMTQGDGTSQMAVLDAASRGADKVVWVHNAQAKKADAFVVANVLTKAVETVDEPAAIVYSASSLGAYGVAQALNVPYISNIVSMEVKDQDFLVERKVGTQLELLQVSGPAVYSLDTSYNLLSFPHINDIVAAKDVPVQTLELKALGLSEDALQAKEVPVKKGKKERKQIILSGTREEQIAQLVDILRNQGAVSPSAHGVMTIGKTRVSLLETKAQAGQVNLSQAERVVAMGMGVAGKEDLNALAQVLTAQLACTRPIAWERKWLGDDAYVGVSGISLGAKLYVGVGLSGAVQHTAGLKQVETVIAINKDPEAAIFQAADYGLVGDYKDIVPALVAALENK